MATAVGDVAGALRRGLRSRESAGRAASVCDRRAERQPPHVDGGDVGTPQRSGGVSGLPALHHACAVERGVGLEAVACTGARTHRRADSRRDELSQARHGLGRRRTAVLRRARQGGELSDSGHGRVVDRGAGVAAGRHVVPPRGVAHATPAGASPDSRDGGVRTEMAVGVDAVAPGPRGRVYGHGRGRRRGVRRQRDAATRVASRQAAVCRGSLVRSQSVPGDPGPHGAHAAAGHGPSARTWAATQAPRRWRLVSWRNGTHAPWRARFCAVRVTPAHEWRAERRLAPEVWLLCERELAGGDRVRYYLVDLPPTASLRALVHLAHQRWAIEQQYQELKDELGLDHFEGRSLPGWQRHVVLTAVAYSFLQNERRRRRQTLLTLPQVRAVIQEVLTAHFFMTQPHYLKWMLKLKEVELRN